MSVVKWSLEVLATGQPARARHDNSPWLKSDTKRKAGKAVQRSCLVEVRADWKFMAGVFKFPAHNLNEGMCWACTCTPEEVKPHISIDPLSIYLLYIYVLHYVSQVREAASTAGFQQQELCQGKAHNKRW